MTATEKQIAYSIKLRNGLRNRPACNADAMFLWSGEYAHEGRKQKKQTDDFVTRAIASGYYRTDWRPFLVEDDDDLLMATREAITQMLQDRRAEIAAMTDEDLAALDGRTISSLIDEMLRFENKETLP